MQKIDQLLLTNQLSIAHPFEKGLNGVQIWLLLMFGVANFSENFIKSKEEEY